MDMREKFYKISSSIIGGDSSTILCHEYCWYKSEITRKKFAVDEEDLIDNIGCNLWKLMEELKQYGKDEAGRL